MNQMTSQDEIGSPEFRPTSDIVAALLAFLAVAVLQSALWNLIATDLGAGPKERLIAEDVLNHSGRYLMTALVGVLLYLRRSPLEHIVLGGFLVALALLLPELGFDPRIRLGLIAVAFPLIQVSAYLHLADQIPLRHRLADAVFLGIGIAILAGGGGAQILQSYLPIGGKTLGLAVLGALAAALVIARPRLDRARLTAPIPGVLGLCLVLILLWRFDLAQILMKAIAPLGLVAAFVLLFDLRVVRSRSLALLLAAQVALRIGVEAVEKARGMNPWPAGGSAALALVCFLVPATAVGVTVLILSDRGSRRRFLTAGLIVIWLVCSSLLFVTAPLASEFDPDLRMAWGRFFFVYQVEKVASLLASMLLIAGLLLETRERWRPLIVAAVVGLAPFVTGWVTTAIWSEGLPAAGFLRPGPETDPALQWTATGVLAGIALLLFWRSPDDPGRSEADAEAAIGDDGAN